jgi:RNA polymerase sigma-32 factor
MAGRRPRAAGADGAKPTPKRGKRAAAVEAEAQPPVAEATAGDDEADEADDDVIEVEATPEGEPEPVLDPAIEPEIEPAPRRSASRSADADEEDSSGGGLVPFDPLQRYLTEIRRYPLLSREEEKELAIQYLKDQDVDAAYKLVTGNLRLVVMIAREYQRATRNLLDLIQEGNIGLMEAVKKFDPYRGIRFPSYAVWWVRAYIIRYLINNWRVVKLGTTQAQRKLFFNLQKEKERLEREGIVPAPKLIAQRLDVKESEVIEMEQRMSSRDLSVDQPSSDEEGGATLLDVLKGTAAGPDEQVADAEFRREVGDKIRAFGETLKDKEKVIFTERLLAEEPLTLQEIGDKYGISRERVRQLEERLKRKLRAYLEGQIKDLRENALDLE